MFDVFDWHVRANSSGLLWTRTQDIPDVGSRNGTAFSCEATLPVIGTRQTNLTVFSTYSIHSGSDVEVNKTPFDNFSVKCTFDLKYLLDHVHISKASLQLSCGDTCQI